MALQITSPEFEYNQSIPVKFTCQGENVNPTIIFGNIPASTKSLALIMDDPDAATDPDGPGKTFDHWVLFNISPSTTTINEDTLPSGATVGNNSANNAHYTGPCPPNGRHRYFFKLYALDTTLDLPSSTTKDDIEAAMQSHIIEQAELIGTYQKN